MKFTSILAFSLVVIGAIVWGLIGLFNFNLVAFIFGAGAAATISRVNRCLLYGNGGYENIIKKIN